ncbi:hypothetical protein VJ786_02345 [Sphingobacterium sp. PU5-4]|uniref:Uncharacterized protein n=1 Tax=Sphingobacterium tenebrionis TaxID=3111775 RepID=A0ABU8I2W0_9SPHI
MTDLFHSNQALSEGTFCYRPKTLDQHSREVGNAAVQIDQQDIISEGLHSGTQ